MERIISLIGMLVLVLVAFFMSDNKRRISFRIVVLGIMLQVAFAFVILPNSPLNHWFKAGLGMREAPGEWFFAKMNDVVIRLLGFAEEGARFLFGNLVNNNVPVASGEVGNGPASAVVGRVAVVGSYFAFNVLPTIIFFSSLMSVLYYLGIMQKVVAFFARIMEKTLGTSGAETLSASANIFVGQTEAPLVVRPYVNEMTLSELMVVMVGGFATVAGGVMAAYVGMLKDYFPSIAGHLISASIMSAPAGIVMA
nr:Na+ dependent nucleoside transporter N-terminal domain-containing protein [bacterium]